MRKHLSSWSPVKPPWSPGLHQLSISILLCAMWYPHLHAPVFRTSVGFGIKKFWGWILTPPLIVHETLSKCLYRSDPVALSVKSSLSYHLIGTHEDQIREYRKSTKTASWHRVGPQSMANSSVIFAIMLAITSPGRNTWGCLRSSAFHGSTYFLKDWFLGMCKAS